MCPRQQVLESESETPGAERHLGVRRFQAVPADRRFDSPLLPSRVHGDRKGELLSSPLPGSQPSLLQPFARVPLQPLHAIHSTGPNLHRMIE